MTEQTFIMSNEGKILATSIPKPLPTYPLKVSNDQGEEIDETYNERAVLLES